MVRWYHVAIVVLAVLLFIYWFPTVDLNQFPLGALHDMFEQLQMTTEQIRYVLDLPTQQIREMITVWLKIDQP